MISIDASENGIFDIAWSPDGRWLAYVSGPGEVRLANVESKEIRVIGPGSAPNLTADLEVVMEQADEIVLVSGPSATPLIGKKQVLKDAPKRSPLLSPDGKALLFVLCNAFDKVSQTRNAYPHRNFLAITPVDRPKPIVTSEQWYGGTAVWFSDGSRFAHFEFDSTAGPQIHIISRQGVREGSMPGTYPAVSPDGTRIAARPRGGGSLMVYTSKGGWTEDQVDLTVLKIPGDGTERRSANPPVWLDNRLVLLEHGGAMWRIDTRRDKTEEMKKLPAPTERRTCSMVASPSRERIALEVAVQDRFELRVAAL